MSSDDFEPHGIYMWLGLDKGRNKIVFRSDLKSRDLNGEVERVKRALETMGWVYCIDCRTPIFDLDAAIRHLRLGHVLATRFMRDEVTKEEVRSVG
ncbi:hypothetical protein [Vulcanisaeta thermophila]|uniref:hypothetical protein n=1 Tax=Vulcanisaeta thermophila TaxID=867917 RepID=UPI000852A905|nr:hypothetical protein [Vulcanisaeta thermophila]